MKLIHSKVIWVSTCSTGDDLKIVCGISLSLKFKWFPNYLESIFYIWVAIKTQLFKAYRSCATWVAAEPSFSIERWRWSPVDVKVIEDTWQENLLSFWSGCLGRCWSTNDERCEDLKRLGSAGKKKSWKARGREEASPPGKPDCHNHGCFLLMLFPCHRSQQMRLFLLAYSLFLPKLLGSELKCSSRHGSNSGCALCSGL